ncbi:MAG: hypothetical protein K2P79_14130 [Sphingomonas sp.]|nr:hypothetical protein [Sphingomonas sp.]
MIRLALAGLVATGAIITPALLAAQDAQPPQAATAPAATPLDALLNAAKPMAEAPRERTGPHRLTKSETTDCLVKLSVEGGTAMTIDLKKMTPMATGPDLAVVGGGHSVQFEFDGEDGAKTAASAEKLITELNDKCG